MRFILILCITFIIADNTYSGVHSKNSILIENAVNNQSREQKNMFRDKYRNPKKTLEFFGIEGTMSVLEILPGRGWYTEILSNILKEEGELIVASFGNHNPNEYLRQIHIDFTNYFSKNHNIFGKFKVVDFYKKDYLSEIKSESLDMVLTFRNTHNWLKNNTASQIYTSFSRVLKTDGILGVVQHKSLDSLVNFKGEKGYVGEDFLIGLVESCGFELMDTSEINRNPLDSKNYSKGVWSLPPTFRDGQKEFYKKIGESDRMTLKFKKKRNATFANCNTY